MMRNLVSALMGALLFVSIGTADARTARSAAVAADFKRYTPCPATGLLDGACPGYEVDHITPLCAGGADHTSNMQWLTREDHRVKTRIDIRHCRALRRAKEEVKPPDGEVIHQD